MSVLRRTLLLLLTLLCLLTVTLLGLFTTTTGLQYLIASAVRWVPGLSVEQISRQGPQVVLAQLRYQTASIDLHVERLQLQPSVGALKTGHLGVNAVQISQLILQISQPHRPLTLKVAELTTALSGDLRQIRVRPSHLENVTLTLPPVPGQLAVPATREPEQSLESQMITLLQHLPSTIRLPLAVNLESITGSHWRFEGAQRQRLNQIALTAACQASLCTVHELTLHSPEAQLTLQGTLGLQQHYPLSLIVSGKVTEPSLPLAGEQLLVKLTGTLQEQLTLQLQAIGPLSLQATAVVIPKTHPLSFKASIHSEALEWPLTASARWQAQAVTGEIQGYLTDYTFSLQARVSGSSLPWSQQPSQEPCDLQLQGEGNQQQLQLTALQLTTPLGRVQATAQIGWSPTWRWQSSLTLQDLHLQQDQLGELTLKGSLEASGQIEQDRWQLALTRLELQGLLNQQPIALSGQLSGQANGHWQIPQFLVSLGDNQLDLRGKLGTHCDLQALIKAPQLTGLLPGLAGAIQGRLTLSGKRESPKLQSDLRLERWHWQQFSLAQAVLKSQISFGQSIHGQTSLQIKQLRQAELTLEQLSLTAQGNEQQHRLQFQALGAPLAGQLQLQGRFERQTGHWQGILTNTTLQTPVGEWHPLEPIQISYQHPQNALRINPHRWRHDQAVIAIPTLTQREGSTEARVEIQRLELALLQPLLQSVTQLQGIVKGHSHLQWQWGERWPRLTVALQGQQITATPVMLEESFPVICRRIQLNLQLAPDKVVLDGQLQLAKEGMLRTHLQIDDPQTERQLSGYVRLKAFSLSSLTPAVKTVPASGILNGNVRLAGTITHPQLFGGVALTQSRLLNLLPIDNLQEEQLHLQFTGQQAQLRGYFQTKSGELRLQGDSQWQHGQAWKSRLAIKGDPLAVSWSPAIQCTVVPDLQVIFKPGQIKLQGVVAIPKAHITLDALPPSAVKVSPHEVLLDNALEPKKKPEPQWEILSDLMLSLGEEVYLTGFGLKTRLEGQLTVRQAQQRLGLHGQITLPEGRLRAYGQNLLIRKGKLIFSGPVDRLLLDIEAIRDPDKTENQVIAGLQLRGRSDAPQITIFSEPKKPPTEALAYLLNGRAPTEGQYSALAAQISLSLLQSGKLAKLPGITHFIGQVGETFGISDLSVDTAVTNNNSSQIVISGYLKRDLQFKYGVDFSTLTLRYRLRPRLYLEMRSGIERALDLLYQFEF